MTYVIGAGEASFYGPKIDLHMTDVLGRSWQMGTIQLRMQMPEPGSVSRTWAPTTRSTASTSIHRALYGSFERFIGILVEHDGGDFPFWLAPVQARVVPVGEAHREAGCVFRDRLTGEGFRVELDEA